MRATANAVNHDVYRDRLMKLAAKLSSCKLCRDNLMKLTKVSKFHATVALMLERATKVAVMMLTMYA